MSASTSSLAPKDPGFVEVFLGAVLSLALGAFLSLAVGMFKPVEVVRELPKEPVKGRSYHIEGLRDSRGLWKQKLQGFLAGESLVLAESDLNAWATPAPAKNKEASASSALETGLVQVGAPQFRIAEGKFQVALPLKVAYLESTVLVRALGSFAKGGQGFRFVPEAIWLGSSRIEKVPGLSGWMLGQFLGKLPVETQVLDQWARLAEVRLEGRQLHLVFP